MTFLRVEDAANLNGHLLETLSNGKREVLNEESFNRMIAIERKRTERSKQPFLLMLLQSGKHQGTPKSGELLKNVISVLMPSVRETDVIGWYKNPATVGVMYTGLVINDKESVLSMILNRVTAMLKDNLTDDQFSEISISFNFFPDDWDDDGPGRPSNLALYPDLLNKTKERRAFVTVKRLMDIAGSTLMLSLCAPVFVVIAAAIKLSSEGPVLFRQQRVGQYGQH
ncbi:MAG: sugar transferase, partial [Candidatus Pacebacteria bacterium]|nr:sugar transferase [Candidatus Paceibacterota bacterium]